MSTQFAQQHGMEFYETSCAIAVNVKEVSTCAVWDVVNQTNYYTLSRFYNLCAAALQE